MPEEFRKILNSVLITVGAEHLLAPPASLFWSFVRSSNPCIVVYMFAQDFQFLFPYGLKVHHAGEWTDDDQFSPPRKEKL